MWVDMAFPITHLRFRLPRRISILSRLRKSPQYLLVSSPQYFGYFYIWQYYGNSMAILWQYFDTVSSPQIRASFCADSSSPPISAIPVGHFTGGKLQSPQISAKLPQQMRRQMRKIPYYIPYYIVL